MLAYKRKLRIALIVAMTAALIMTLLPATAFAADPAIGSTKAASIEWARTTESSSSTKTVASALGWKWSDVSSLNVNEKVKVWDAIYEYRNEHYYTGYLKNSGSFFGTIFEGTVNVNYTPHDAATWKKFAREDEHSSMRRFQGTFEVPEGYSVADTVMLTSVGEYAGLGNIVPINDDLFVFIYPKGTTINNSNFLNYMAFWTGTSNQDGIQTFGTVQGTEPTWDKTNKVPKHTDGWYCKAGTDNVGETMLFADPTGDTTDWVIDIFTGDYAGGGGMDRMDVIFKKTSTNNALTVNYYMDEVNENNLLGSEVKKNLNVGDKFTLTPGTGSMELNKEKANIVNKGGDPANYEDGVQLGEKPYEVKAGTDNIINVVYPTKSINYVVKYYKDSVSADDSNLLGQSSDISTIYNSTVDLAAGTNNGQLNAFKAAAGAGYKDGVQQGGTATITTNGQVIEVVYPLNQFNYKEKHVYNGTVNPTYTVDKEVSYGAPVAAEQHKKTGYVFTGITVTAEDKSTLGLIEVSGIINGTMPACDVEVVYNYSLIDYTYKVIDDYGQGHEFTKIRIDETKNYEDTIVAVAPAPEAGYKVTGMTVAATSFTGLNINNDAKTVDGNMPAADVVITYTYEKDEFNYQIIDKYSDSDVRERHNQNYIFEADVENAVANPDAGYKVAGMTVETTSFTGLNINNDAKTVDGNMPAADVVITYTYEAILYNYVVIDDYSGDRVARTEITKTVEDLISESMNEKSGYKFSSVTVAKPEQTELLTSGSNVTGTMPAADVEIIYTYRASAGTPYTVNYYFWDGVGYVLDNSKTTEVSAKSGESYGTVGSMIQVADYSIDVLGYSFVTAETTENVDGSETPIEVEAQTSIRGDGKRILNLYYTNVNIQYQISHYYKDYSDLDFSDPESDVQLGSAVTVTPNYQADRVNSFVIKYIVVNGDEENKIEVSKEDDLEGTITVESILANGYVFEEIEGREANYTLDVYYEVGKLVANVKHIYTDKTVSPNAVHNPDAQQIDLYQGAALKRLNELLETSYNSVSYNFVRATVSYPALKAVKEEAEADLKKARTELEKALTDEEIDYSELENAKTLALSDAETLREEDLTNAKQAQKEAMEAIETAISEATEAELEAFESARIMSPEIATAIEDFIVASGIDQLAEYKDKEFIKTEILTDLTEQKILDIELFITALEKVSGIDSGFAQGVAGSEIKDKFLSSINEQEAVLAAIKAEITRIMDAYGQQYSEEETDTLASNIQTIGEFVEGLVEADEKIQTDIKELEKSIDSMTDKKEKLQKALDEANDEEDTTELQGEISSLGEKISDANIELEELLDAELETRLDTNKENLEAVKAELDKLNASELITTSLQGLSSLFDEAGDSLTALIDALAAYNSAFAEETANQSTAKSNAEAEFDAIKESVNAAREEAKEAANKAYDQGLIQLAKENSLSEDLITAFEDSSKTVESLMKEEEVFTSESALEGYEFHENYEYSIVFEYEKTSSGNRGTSPNNPRTTEEVAENETPLATPEDIFEEDVPLATPEIEDLPIPLEKLPKTGGVAAGFLYGFGILLAGGGVLLRRRADK